MSPFDQIVNKIVLRISLLASLVAYSTVMAEEKKAEVQITDVKSSQQILEYRVRLLGLPIGARSVIKINRSGKNLAVSNLIESPFVRNHHTSEFTMSRCDFMQLKYTNSGNVLSWKFNDNIEFDWNRKKIRYWGVEEEIHFDFTDETFVDKLSQYDVIKCRIQDQTKSFVLSYVDNTIAHYRFEVIGREMLNTPVGEFEAVLLESTPVVSRENTIHNSVQYWLAPQLGYYPLKIKSTVMGLPFTVLLNKIVNGSADDEN